ncbi:MAG: hypothetical protein RIQ89_1270 [Bacteroidota bacterium]|jgi:hypothetical protein
MAAPDPYSQDTIHFCGYQWQAKESNGKITGPGRNFFSSSNNNVWVDEEGKLHLAITQDENDRWYCSEVRLAESLGYGTYVFNLAPLASPLDKNIVIGFFTYDKTDTSLNHREIDIEISHWGAADSANTQYVIQPYQNTGNLYRFSTPLSTNSIHQFEWKKKKISFQSMIYQFGQFSSLTNWIHKPKQALKKNKEKFSINLWLYKSDSPADGKPKEIIIESFKFIPLK